MLTKQWSKSILSGQSVSITHESGRTLVVSSWIGAHVMGRGSGESVFFFYRYTALDAVRGGRWKLVLPRPEHPPWTGWSGRFDRGFSKNSKPIAT